nr:MAG: ORF1 [TTV-like mini virus]
MPFWRRRWYYPYRWRRRRYTRRRPRKTFRRTFYRRRYRVRKRYKRKLKLFNVKQFNPQTVRKLKVKGILQLFFTTRERIDHNNTLYIDETTAFHLPGGGGFSLSQMTLQNLYDEHLRLRNWWTKSNDTLPLIKYYGCSVRLYYQPNVDYIFAYNNCFPMKASRLCYNGTQPSVMMLMKHRKIIASKNYKHRKKPYKKLFIRPPAQLKNQWYFQSTIANVPLVNFMATAASLERFYTPSSAITTTIRFFCLDPLFFNMHDFKYKKTYGYQPKPNKPLFADQQAERFEDIYFDSLTYLGNSFDFGLGAPINTVVSSLQGEAKWNTYFTDNKHWGNPFMQNYLDHTMKTIACTVDIGQLRQYFSTKNWNLHEKLTDINKTHQGWFGEITTPYYYECRYTPHKDKGAGNEVYFLHIDNNARQGWDPEPNKPELIARDLPLWTLYWGLPDWQKVANIITSVETHGITVFKTQYVTPKNQVWYIPIGEHFLTERSPYFPFATEAHETQRSKSDEQNWHPKLSFQLETINTICSTGPGTIKLPKDTSVEGKLAYTFHFKVGGCPPPMEIIANPQEQPQWNIPSNFNDEPSLQSPSTPFQHFLYHFDQRGDYLTKTAVERLKKEFPAKETVSSITGRSTLNIPPQKTQESDSETPTEEEDHQTLLLKLQQQQQEFKLLKHSIKQLLRQRSMLE